MSTEIPIFFKKYLAEAEKNAGGWSPSLVELWREAELIPPKECFENFRRNWISSGVYNRPDRPSTQVDPKDFLVKSFDWDYGKDWPKRLLVDYAYLIRRLYKVLKALPANLLTTFINKCPDDYEFGGEPLYVPGIGKISESSLRYTYYALKSLDLMPSTSVIFEIGAGVGGLCKKFYECGYTGKYYITDLPVNAALIATNLGREFGDNFGMYWKLDDREELNRRVVFVAPWLLDQLDLNVDLVINTACFQHMSLANLLFYSEIIEKFRSKFIYHNNRVLLRDASDVSIDKYPFRKKYSTVFQQPGILGGSTIEELLAYKGS
jgi:hypothetical protein